MDSARDVKEIVERYPKETSSLIQILQDIHGKYNYLPKDALKGVSTLLNVPISKVYSVATFYKAFSLKPRGKIIIKVCKGTACHIRGAELIGNSLEEMLKIKAGETTKDLKFTFEEVNCVGACAMAPVIIIDDKYHGSMKPEKLKKLIKT